MFLSTTLIENLIREDLPYSDLTTETMGISEHPAVMEFSARYACTLAGMDEASTILRHLGANVEPLEKNGTTLAAGTLVLRAKGSAGVLHAGWKVAQNMMEHAVGIATRTHEMVIKGRSINPDLIIACTRKCVPGAKTISLNAIQAGGGTVHRLGLSESFLLFDNHTAFFNSEDHLLATLKKAVIAQPERKLVVECDDLDYAMKVAACGIDVIQFDKVPPSSLQNWVMQLKKRFAHLTIAAAGGINIESIQAYAKTGIDIAVTSFIYTGKPLDIAVTIKPL
ncbi:ModD protein [Celerinatantimonas yamalensis]|uniref:Putative pyrophosphorylase ModD n=1 Tax=Celerinatantimonas yamalensis TaxID=559956 RepID=A0ABW9G5Q1_9GAMM